MTHKLDRHDVYAAVARYRELTGDQTSILEQEGALWSLKGSGFQAYGKEKFVLLLRAYCIKLQAQA